MDLETDANGIVTFLPVIVWGVTIVQARTVGLAVDYYANAADVAAKKLTRIQLNIDPNAAAEIGRLMQERAELILSGKARIAPLG